MNIDYQDIGRRIRKRRKEKGYTQEVLAEIAEISVQHLSHIETANTKLSLPVIVGIANALDTSVDDLLRESIDHVEHINNAEINELIKKYGTKKVRKILKLLFLLEDELCNF